MRTSGAASGRAALYFRAQVGAWRFRLGMLKTMGRRLKQVLWHSLGLNPPNRGLERTVAVLRQQRQALNTKLAQTQADLVQLRTELAGTQAGERTAKYQAMHDGLTGQPNRRMFMAALKKALCNRNNTGIHVSVVYIDIDGFKLINDCHGHKVGDSVLRTVGARLAKSVRAGDMVARLGGDEFACLLQGTLTTPQLLALAHKLHDSIAAPMKLGNLALHVHVSIGLACAPEDGLTADTLLDRADAAMYHATQHRMEVMLASALEWRADASTGRNKSGPDPTLPKQRQTDPGAAPAIRSA